ncbi:MAG: LysR family transcriptional regulator [Gammaproteobacteria bacterium]|nr:MAG: LysR family transcriptional regulator [Gammaproteobacteria bacterium]
MRLRHIEIFHAVYTTGSITNAAKILHVSQPSVSKVLAHAEMSLGFALFQRMKGRLIPTCEADLLFDEVDNIYQQLRSIRNTAENIKKHDYGRINLALSPALGFDVIPKALSNFKQQHQGISVNLLTMHNHEVLQSLHEHKCDLAVMFSPAPMSGVETIIFGDGEFVIMYPKYLFPQQPKKLSLKSLLDHELIGIGNSGPLDDLVWNRFMEEGVSLKSSIQVETFFIAARMTAQNIGICIVDEFTARCNLSNSVAIASFDPPLTFPVKGLHLENKQLSKACEDFVCHIKSSINE